jgi:dTDP-4-amino-4,6-dideoxygalactose transaminase
MLDFARQFAGLREEILEAIESVCDSQRFILGPEVASFERAAALACASPHAVGCASGTDALWLAFAAAGIGTSTQSFEAQSSENQSPSSKPDAVITSPFSFFASASAILRAGARPLFADIDPLTYNLAPTSVQAVLEQERGFRIRAVLPVHLYGQCADWDGFTALQINHPGLLLIEDAAQAFGAAWSGIPAGGLGDAACFSFYPTKNLAAMGDAGLMTTRSAALAERASMLRAHGMRRRYFHDEVGWNSRLDTIQAAVLGVKLKYVAGWNQQRRELAARYNEMFHAAGLASHSGITAGIVLPYTHPRAQHVFHQYVIRAPRRNQLRQYLTERRIGCEIYYPLPLHLQESLAGLGYKPGDFPHAERAAAEVLALPMFPELREDEQAAVVQAIRNFYA